MSRFAANPKRLIYLPPTMSPSETTKRDGLLEHPVEAFSYCVRVPDPRDVPAGKSGAREGGMFPRSRSGN